MLCLELEFPKDISFIMDAEMMGGFNYESLADFVPITEEMYVSTLFAIVFEAHARFDLERKSHLEVIWGQKA